MHGWLRRCCNYVSVTRNGLSLNTLGKQVDDYKGSFSLVPVVQVSVDVGQEGKPILLNGICG